MSFIDKATSVVRSKSGTYAGDDSDSKQISVGFQCKLVVISLGALSWTLSSTTASKNAYHNQAANKDDACMTTALHATDGFIVSKTSDGANDVGQTYAYTAIG